MRKWAALPAVAGVLLFSTLTWYTGAEPWFDPALSVDGQSYAQGMMEIAGSRDFLRLKDLYHSPGYQLYLGALCRVAGPRRVFGLIKALAWLMGVLCVVLVFWLGEACFGPYAGAIAATLLAFSSKWAAYINILQYEVLLAFDLTLLAAALMLAPAQDAAEPAWIAVASLCLSAACFLHFRLLVLVPLAAWALWRRRRKMGLVLLLALPPLAASAAWSAYQSHRLGRLVVIQDMSAWSDQFRMHNHPASRGFAFPYIPPVEPSGAAFVASRPLSYLWLVKERFLYLWDFRKDVWYVGPTGTSDLLLRLAACLLFFGGLALRLSQGPRGRDGSRDEVLYIILATGFAGPLLSTGSSRFLVPILPFVCLFQSYAVRRLLPLRERPTADFRRRAPDGGATH